MLAAMVGRHIPPPSRWRKTRLLLAACGALFCVSWLGADTALATTPAAHDGKDGKNGINGHDGTNGKDGIDGKRGPRGPQGLPGPDMRVATFKFPFGIYVCPRTGGTNADPLYDCSSGIPKPKGP
jgi:hypothetical protein